MDDFWKVWESGEHREELLSLIEEAAQSIDFSSVPSNPSGYTAPFEKWHTANDKHVCKLCRSVEGNLKPNGDEYWTSDNGHISLPAHDGCRCWSVPSLG